MNLINKVKENGSKIGFTLYLISWLASIGSSGFITYEFGTRSYEYFKEKTVVKKERLVKNSIDDLLNVGLYVLPTIATLSALGW